MGFGFQNKILPVLRLQQRKFEPANASSSKSPALLRNTFNAELYKFFNKKAGQAEEERKYQASLRLQ